MWQTDRRTRRIWYAYVVLKYCWARQKLWKKVIEKRINWIVYRCRSGTLKCYARHEMSCAMTGSKDSIIQLQRRWEKIFVKLGEKNSVKKQPAIELVECEELRHCYSSQRRRRRRTTSLVSGSTRKSASTEHGVFLDHGVSFSFSLFGPFWRHWYVIAAADAVYACSVIVLD